MNWNQYSTSWGSSLQQWMVICLCDFIIFHLTFPFVTSLFSIDFFHHHYQLLLFQLLLHQSKAFISFDLQHLRTPQYICLLIYSIYISTIASRSFRQSIYRTIISHKSLETKYLRSHKSIYRIITAPFLLNYNSFFSLKLLQQLFS